MYKKRLGTHTRVILKMLGLVILLAACQPFSKPAEVISEATLANPVDTSQYAQVLMPRTFIFPADHGPHPDFLTEWWYYTGNLITADGERYGYQLTFFRRALQPVNETANRQSQWGASQVYMAHFALSDIHAGQFHVEERLSRGAAGLAGAQGEPFVVWVEDWRVEQSPVGCTPGSPAPCAYRLYAKLDNLAIELNLSDLKGPILQGQEGFSPKGPTQGQASYYYSLPRLQTSGTLTIGAKTLTVSGSSWMDHEFSTRALDNDQVGWDWFSMQFEDGGELMVFQIRRADGSIDPYSSGTWIAANGQTLPLQDKDFNIQVENTWRSPHSQALYPAGWTITIPKLEINLKISPHLSDQELNVSYVYWEGAVSIQGNRGGYPLLGNGYVELTGYAGAMSGEF